MGAARPPALFHPPPRQAGIEKCTQLRVLYASNNRIKDWAEVERLAALPLLEDLLLVGNPLYCEWRDNNALPQYRVEVGVASCVAGALAAWAPPAATWLQFSMLAAMVPACCCSAGTQLGTSTQKLLLHPASCHCPGAQAGAHTEEAGRAAGGCGGAGGGAQMTGSCCARWLGRAN